ncbi:MAG: mechanosensitive ion channel domain-containing protein [Acidimicrobiia bacterium]
MKLLDTLREPWLAALGIVLVGILAAAVVGMLMRRLSTRVLGDAERANRLATLAVVAVLLVFAAAAVSRLVDPGMTDPGLAAAAGRVFSALPDIVIAVVLVVSGLVLGMAVRGLLRRALEPLRPAVADLAAPLGYWSVVGLAVLLAADQVGIQTGFLQRLLLVALAGFVAAAALSFGLGSRDLVGAVVAGRHVAQIVAVGDEVEVAGTRGVVTMLGHASVRLRLPDGREAEVPHRHFLDQTVLIHARAVGS